ncbi:MAG: hypothetical protein L0Z62_08150 [Gemmataceae bacterium]|nr:hypothetical protein [Gemmataceae bacterium]
MRLPQPTDYNEAIQDPRLCFRDDDLRGGSVGVTPLGLPRPHSGNFADVYQVNSADGAHSWAVKCFTRSVEGLQQRYQAISDHLHSVNLSFLIDFQYLTEGIRVHGSWFPVLKMRWVEGFTLNEFVRRHLDRPPLLNRLASMWVRLARQLRRARIAHADLQHGNVLLVASARADRLRLRLIDYDGMFVPVLAESPSGEVGHPNYQHPQRLREGTYHADIDRFSHLVIYTALRALQGNKELWKRYDNGENLLFREQDFREPADSLLLRELWESGEQAVRRLAGLLVIAASGPLTSVPALDELLTDSDVPPLSPTQEHVVEAALTRPRRGAWWAADSAATTAVREDEAAAELLAAGPEEMVPLEPVLDVLPVEPGLPAEPGLLDLSAGSTGPAASTSEPAERGSARARQVRVFLQPAAGHSEDEFHGAAAGLLARGRFAVAEAVPDSLHALPWATLLAEDFVEGRQAQPAAWSAWLPPLQMRWATEAVERTGDPLPRDLHQEALASFLGLVVQGRWLGRRWQAVAIGECCLFQIRSGLLYRSFPLTRPADLDAAEGRVGARTSFEVVLRKQEARGEGDWAPGDTFWLMSRALGRWFLRQVQEWQRPWDLLEPLLDRPGQAGFTEWVEELRQQGELGEGDVTLVGVYL